MAHDGLSRTHEPRLNNFDAVRLIAALLVIWGHQFTLMNLPVPIILGGDPGSLGVIIFFAISGYLITQSWQADPHLGRFAARRILRIWPGLCTTVLLCMLVLGPLVSTLAARDYFRHPLTWEYLANIWLDTQLRLPGVFETNPHAGSVNGPLWTIPLEVGCYVVLAVLGAVGVLRWRHGAAAVLLVLACAMQWRYGFVPAGKAPPPWSPGLQFGMMFAVGCMLARWRSLWEHRRWSAVAFFMAGAWALRIWGIEPLASQGTYIVLAGVAVVTGSASLPFVSRAGRFGDFSYGLYIYAFPVQQLVVWLFSNRLPFTAALVLSTGGALLLAFLSWHFVEKPALNFKPRRPSEQKPDALASGARAGHTTECAAGPSRA